MRSGQKIESYMCTSSGVRLCGGASNAGPVVPLLLSFPCPLNKRRLVNVSGHLQEAHLNNYVNNNNLAKVMVSHAAQNSY